jgi:hypothetical protein
MHYIYYNSTGIGRVYSDEWVITGSDNDIAFSVVQEKSRSGINGFIAI